MHWFKRNPIFFTVLFLLIIAFAVEVVVLLRERRSVEEARQTYRNKVEEYERLRTHAPSITRDNLELAREDLERVEENLATIKEALGAGTETEEMFGDPPANSNDMYFALTNFVEEYRDKAAASGGEEGVGIRLRNQEFFGFSQYMNSGRGPAAPLIQDVHKQQQIVGYLLDTLFAASPVELVAVQRGAVGGADGGGDTFNISDAISARIPGFVETYPFRLSFVGRSRTLRSFLNSLAAFEMPILVRSVEVVPADGEGAGGGDRRARRTVQQASATEGAESEAVPIVESSLSRFDVTVEFIELVSSEEASAEASGSDGNGSQ